MEPMKRSYVKQAVLIAVVVFVVALLLVYGVAVVHLIGGPQLPSEKVLY